MISAMYENGGNTTHRFLDGHPELFVYPFESQLGTRFVVDHLSSTFPLKYRWPVFDLAGTPERDYAAIIDEECKVRALTPGVSKFRDYPFDFSDEERRDLYVERVRVSGRSTAANVEAFFAATFEAWKDHHASGRESVYVGYSPIVIVDAERILEVPGAHVLHVVRNPWSAYADTKKRAVPLPLRTYMLGWVLNQYHAMLASQEHPERVHVVRVEEVMADSVVALAPVCAAIDVESAGSLSEPSWNGATLEQVYPWGTIRTPTPATNLATANELSGAEKEEVRRHAGSYLDLLGYAKFLNGGSLAEPRLAGPAVPDPIG
jgi:hypothetical protein